MASEAISIQVDGQTWYCDNLKVKQQIEGIKDKTEQKAVLERLSKGSSPLVSLDENTFVDISEMTEEDDDKVEEKETSAGEIKGFDENSYDRFTREYGLKTFNTIDDNSSAEDIEEALNEIQKKTEALSSEVNKLANATKQEDIENVYSAITNIQTALDKLGTSCTNAATPKPKEESFGEKLVKGFVALVLLSNPIGWIVGGKMHAANKNAEAKRTEAYNNVQNKISEAKKDLAQMRELADENVNEALDSITEDLTDDLADVMDENGNFDFSNVNPSMIMSNVKTINSVLEGLQKYADVCEKYGISTENTTELIEGFKGLDGKSLAQEYVDGYAESLNLGLTGGVLCDTANLSDLYTEIDTLIRQLGSQGIDTTALEGTLETIIEENQKEAEAAAKDYTPASTGDLAGDIAANTDSANAASDLANGIEGNASSYDVSTGALIDSSIDLTRASQQQIDDYVKGIDTSSATSLAALDEMYAQINTTYTDLQNAGTMLDVSGIENKLNEITKTKQEIIDKKQKDFEFLVNAAKTVEGYLDIETKINDYISRHSGAGVDMTGIAALGALATSKREELQAKENGTTLSTDETENKSNNTEEDTDSQTVDDKHTSSTFIPTDPKLDGFIKDVEHLKDNLDVVDMCSEALLNKIKDAAQNRLSMTYKDVLRNEVTGIKELYGTCQKEFNEYVLPNSYLAQGNEISDIKTIFAVINERIGEMDEYLN